MSTVQIASYEHVTATEDAGHHNTTISTNTKHKSSLKYGCAAAVVGLVMFTALIVWNVVLTSQINELQAGHESSENVGSIMISTTMPITTSTPTTAPTSTAPTAFPTSSTPTTLPTISPTQFCQHDDYFKSVLKEEYSEFIGGIIKNGDNKKKYEASGVTYDYLRDVYWVVFDNLHSIGKLSSDLTRNDDNILVPPSTDIKINGDDDGYEGIAYDPETTMLYLLTESVGFDTKNNAGDDEEMYHPIIRSVVYAGDGSTYQQTAICVVNMTTPTVNKGLEGLDVITIDGEKYFVALCEGNYCSYSDEGKDAGHGRLILIEFQSVNIDTNTSQYEYLMDEGIDCVYNVINIFALPSFIEFVDYSDFQFMIDNSSGVENQYDVVIVSQESSALWVGQMVWTVSDGLVTPIFDNDYDDEMYPLPYGGDCEVIFCNIEGVTFLSTYEFVMVSDSAKRGGDQPWVCGLKDQSIHVLKLP